MRLLVVLPLISLLALGCGKDKPKDATGSAGSSGSTGSAGTPVSAGPSCSAAAASSHDDLDTKDILARTEVAKQSYVRGVLLSWREREAFYAANQLELDPRAQARDRAAAAKLAKEI